MAEIKTIEFKDDLLYLIDQRKLPTEYEIFECKTFRDVDFAIHDMVVRGAPAIGATAAYGVVLAAKEFLGLEKDEFFQEMDKALEQLNKSRPTAVNLMWAISKMRAVIEGNKEQEIETIYKKIKEEADKIFNDDIAINKAMAKHGNEIIKEGDRKSVV